jgi:AcrR family transcriptional regulator
MSASHLLYYFKGKEAILEQYFANVSVRFLERIDSFSEQAPERQIESLADFWFKSEAGTRQEIGFMLECFGAAVNDTVLQGTKAEFDTHCKAYLVTIFEQSPTVFMGSPKDAAEISYSLMIGLRSAVYFDDNIGLHDAHRLFVGSMRAMCGFD